MFTKIILQICLISNHITIYVEPNSHYDYYNFLINFADAVYPNETMRTKPVIMKYSEN